MANTMSKLTIGFSVLVVLLMLFSSVPVAAEETNDDPVYEEIAVDANKDEKGKIYKWEWDCKTFTLTLEDTVYAEYISISGSGDNPPNVTVKVLGTVILREVILENYNCLYFANNINTATITGGGEIRTANNYISSWCTDKLVIDNVSLDFTKAGSWPVLYSDSDLLIQNCPMIKMTTHNVILNCVNGSVEVVNSNLILNKKSSTNVSIIISHDGISMPVEPTGNGLIYDEGSEWQSGVTKIISGPSNQDCVLTMESFNPPAENNPLPDNFGIIVCSMAAVIALVLIWSIYSKKH